ncbi:hypothetical protein NMY22_g20025 [Coprinellus aureogranulatus]|nr:hypothetical protein NMY22_g20025 [Coprinellus aureogranulatus]
MTSSEASSSREARLILRGEARLIRFSMGTYRAKLAVVRGAASGSAEAPEGVGASRRLVAPAIKLDFGARCQRGFGLLHSTTFRLYLYLLFRRLSTSGLREDRSQPGAATAFAWAARLDLDSGEVLP